MDESPNEASFRASPDGIIDPALREQPTADSAPRYPIPTDRLAAVEIPAIVENVDRAIKAFGRAPSLDHVGVSILTRRGQQIWLT
jgi:general transcription factor 3C polypeptide 5 (transcription factor C subunit 1)